MTKYYKKLIYYIIGDKMKLNKISKSIPILLLILFIIQILTIYSSTSIIDVSLKHIYIKQIIFIVISILLVLYILTINNKTIYNISPYLYIVNLILLVLVLFIGKEVNGSKSWFNLPFFSFQPSEFMKISLILYNSKLLSEYELINYNSKREIIFICKIFLITIIPSILTFMQPDTGNIIMYFIILIVMLFISTVKIKYLLILASFPAVFAGALISIYYYSKDLFMHIFGSNSFYRIERILKFAAKDSYQYLNGIKSIGSSGYFGHGYRNNLVYIPEAHTDYIFAVFASNFGFIVTSILFIILLVFDIVLLNVAKNTKENIDKYMICGFTSILIYSQIQNIGMILGLMPITGITLPFISYGGSSLISYMILIGLVLNASKNTN